MTSRIGDPTPTEANPERLWKAARGPLPTPGPAPLSSVVSDIPRRGRGHRFGRLISLAPERGIGTVTSHHSCPLGRSRAAAAQPSPERLDSPAPKWIQPERPDSPAHLFHLLSEMSLLKAIPWTRYGVCPTGRTSINQLQRLGFELQEPCFKIGAICSGPTGAARVLSGSVPSRGKRPKRSGRCQTDGQTYSHTDT